MFQLPEFQLQVFQYLQLFPDFFVVREVCRSWNHMIDCALGLRTSDLYPLKLTTLDLVELLSYVKYGEHPLHYVQLYPQLSNTCIDQVIEAMCKNTGIESGSIWKGWSWPFPRNLVYRLIWRHQRWLERLVGCELVCDVNPRYWSVCLSLKQVTVTARPAVCRYYEEETNEMSPIFTLVTLDTDTILARIARLGAAAIIKDGMTVDGVSVRPLILSSLIHNRMTPELVPLLNQMNLWLSVALNTSCTVPPQHVAWAMLQNDHQQGTDMIPLIVRYVKRFHQREAHSFMQCGSVFDFLDRCLAVGWIEKKHLTMLYLDLVDAKGFCRTLASRYRVLFPDMDSLKRKQGLMGVLFLCQLMQLHPGLWCWTKRDLADLLHHYCQREGQLFHDTMRKHKRLFKLYQSRSW